MVGYAYTSFNDCSPASRNCVRNGVKHAAIWDGRAITDLNTAFFSIGSGWVLTEATGINDLGQIVGYASNGSASKAFLLTPINPVPLPTAAWLMLAGIGALATAAKRRKAIG